MLQAPAACTLPSMGAPGRVDGARVLGARGCAKSGPASLSLVAPLPAQARPGRGFAVAGGRLGERERGGEGAGERGNTALQEDNALLGVPLADNAGSPSRI